MLNHEVHHYNLLSTPMGKMNRIGDKNPPFLPSKVPYWLVIRNGEAPALTPARM